jgi:hypothetical protein
MTDIKNIVLPVIFVGIFGGLFYLVFKNNDLDYGQVLAPLIGDDDDAPPGMAANAGPSGGSRKRRGKKVKKSRRKGKKH